MTSNQRVICWFSCGAASAVATKLAIKAHQGGAEIIVAYCETGAEHEDNKRFMAQCEDWFGYKVTSIVSDTYKDTWDVWEKTRWLAGINGARCTTELKVSPRLAFQKPTDIHVFGYTNDRSDVDRATRLRTNYPELTIETPLITSQLDKSNCLALIKSSGIEVPKMYELGFQNNNCIPCVKATSPAYWALVRKQFPSEFARMSKLSRELGVRLCRVKGERKFIDEIPEDHPVTNPIAPACDFLCHLIEEEMAENEK
jgi:3'-phosphoadenosine 5'-phosphosulfate sulfotransferase (PAPS reductase)/FAD synthetase